MKDLRIYSKNRKFSHKRKIRPARRNGTKTSWFTDKYRLLKGYKEKIIIK